MFVFSYTDPDLDGVASAVGYAELLRAQGQQVKAALLGEMDGETRYHFETQGIMGETQASVIVDNPKISDIHQFVLVDVAHMNNFTKDLSPDLCVEIIDHHVYVDAAGNFPHLSSDKIDNRKIGATASLVTQRFRDAGINPKPFTAQLLYGAIYSNTYSLRSTVTTDFDRDNAAWLEQKYGLSAEKIQPQFKARTQNFACDLHRAVEMNISSKGYLQLEVCGVEQFVCEYDELIDQVFKREMNLETYLRAYVDVETCVGHYFPVGKMWENIFKTQLPAAHEKAAGHYTMDPAMMRKEVMFALSD